MKAAALLTFSLSATGTVACTAKIFLWDHSDHIVVSDIDGTITKCVAENGFSIPQLLILMQVRRPRSRVHHDRSRLDACRRREALH